VIECRTYPQKGETARRNQLRYLQVVASSVRVLVVSSISLKTVGGMDSLEKSPSADRRLHTIVGSAVDSMRSPRERRPRGLLHDEGGGRLSDIYHVSRRPSSIEETAHARPQAMVINCDFSSSCINGVGAATINQVKATTSTQPLLNTQLVWVIFSSKLSAETHVTPQSQQFTAAIRSDSIEINGSDNECLSVFPCYWN
jgi:hypothetical protein